MEHIATFATRPLAIPGHIALAVALFDRIDREVPVQVWHASFVEDGSDQPAVELVWALFYTLYTMAAAEIDGATFSLNPEQSRIYDTLLDELPDQMIPRMMFKLMQKIIVRTAVPRNPLAAEAHLDLVFNEIPLPHPHFTALHMRGRMLIPRALPVQVLLRPEDPVSEEAADYADRYMPDGPGPDLLPVGSVYVYAREVPNALLVLAEYFGDRYFITCSDLNMRWAIPIAMAMLKNVDFDGALFMLNTELFQRMVDLPIDDRESFIHGLYMESIQFNEMSEEEERIMGYYFLEDSFDGAVPAPSHMFTHQDLPRDGYFARRPRT